MAEQGSHPVYERFVLRDLLSFVTPGLILITTIVFLERPFVVLKDVSYAVWIALIPLSYVLGIAVQILGEVTKIILFYDLESFGKFQKRRNEVMHLIKDNPIHLQQLERFTVLRQLCGNNALALFIACTYFIIFLSNQEVVHPRNWYRISIILSVILFLYLGHLIHVQKLSLLERQIIVESGNESEFTTPRSNVGWRLRLIRWLWVKES